MTLRSLFLASTFALAVTASSDWTFSGGKATVLRRGEAEGTSSGFSTNSPIASPIGLGPKDTLRLSLVLKNGEEAAQPHQAFVLLKDAAGDLETFYPLSVKSSNGRAKLDLSHKDIPAHLLDTSELSLSLVLGSFGEASPLFTTIGSITPEIDESGRATLQKQKEKELGDETRFGPKNEIRHTFRADPKNPPVVITLAFLIAVLVSFVGILGAWFPFLGGNLSHLPKALGASPIGHTLFFGSLIGLEAVFVLYYTSFNLFQTLGLASVLGVTAFFSGNRALREVKARRERGER